MAKAANVGIRAVSAVSFAGRSTASSDPSACASPVAAATTSAGTASAAVRALTGEVGRVADSVAVMPGRPGEPTGPHGAGVLDEVLAARGPGDQDLPAVRRVRLAAQVPALLEPLDDPGHRGRLDV